MYAIIQRSKNASELSRKNASVPRSAITKKLMAQAPSSDSAKTIQRTGSPTRKADDFTSATTTTGAQSSPRSGIAARFSAL